MKTRVLVSGFGFMGQTHAASLLKFPDAELAGIIEPNDLSKCLTIKGNQETETVSAEQIRDVPHYRSMDEALASAGADAVVIALPTRLHCHAVLQGLNAGLHVFVEKPFAIRLQECRQMTECAEKNRRILAVGYVLRFDRSYLRLKECIASGRLGKLKFMKLTRITGIPNWGKWKDPETLRTSGGGLFDLLSHDIDFARFCLGDPESIESTPGLGGEQFRFLSSVLHYADTDVLVEGGFVTPSSYPFGCSYTAYFENGTLVCGDEGNVIEYTGNGKEEIVPEKDDSYFMEMAQFLRAVQTGDCSRICTGKDAQQTIACCTEIAESISYPLPE